MELNPGAETFNITLQRDNQSQSWGFRLQGGKDFPTPLSVSMVNPGGIGEQFGIKTGDAVLQINGVNTDVLEHEQAKYEILKCGNHVNFLLQRGVVKVWKPQVTSFAEMKQGQPGNLPPGYDDSFVQKTSLAANKGDPLRIGSAHNRTARPFAGFGSQPASQPAPPPANPPSYNQPPQQQYSEPPQQQYSQPPQQQYSQPPQQQYSQPPQQQYSQPQQQHGQQQQQYGQQPQQYGGAPQYGQASPDQPSHQPQYSPQGGGYVPAEIDDGIGGKGLVHAQYNSPMGMYSNENVMDTFQIHATVLAQDLNKMTVSADTEVSSISSQNNAAVTNGTSSNTSVSSTIQVPDRSTINMSSERSTIQVPSERSTIEVPSERSTIQVPSERSTIQVPSERSTIQVPSERSTIQVPSERSTIQVPSERPTIQVPSERPTIQVPSERPTIKVSSERSTIKIPPKPSTIKIPPKPSTIHLPPKPSTIQAKPERSTIQIPPKPSTIQVPSERSTIQVPSRATIQVPAPKNPLPQRQPSPTLLAAIQDEESKKGTMGNTGFEGSNPHKQSRSFKLLEAGLSDKEDHEVAAEVGVSGFKSVRAPVAKPPSEKQPAQLMTCKACGGLCTGVFVRIKGDPMHPECFKCVKCGVHLKNKGYFVVEGRLYCDVHAKQVAQPPAPGMVAVPVFK